MAISCTRTSRAPPSPTAAASGNTGSPDGWAGQVISARHHIVIYDAVLLADAIYRWRFKYPEPEILQVPIERLVIGCNRREELDQDQDQCNQPGRSL